VTRLPVGRVFPRAERFVIVSPRLAGTLAPPAEVEEMVRPYQCRNCKLLILNRAIWRKNEFRTETYHFENILHEVMEKTEAHPSPPAGFIASTRIRFWRFVLSMEHTFHY
jgi:hypothetical protein